MCVCFAICSSDLEVSFTSFLMYEMQGAFHTSSSKLNNSHLRYSAAKIRKMMLLIF